MAMAQSTTAASGGEPGPAPGSTASASADLPIEQRPEFAPFVRHDQYGTAGRKPQTLFNKIRLLLLSVTLAPVKLILVTAAVVSFFTIAQLITMVVPPAKRYRHLAFWGKIHCRLALIFLGFWSVRWRRVVHERGKPAAQKPYGAIICNHCSWVDILLFMSKYFPSFVAKKATEDIVLVGKISKAMNCLYVDRESRLAAANTSVGQGTAAKVAARMRAKIADPASIEQDLLLFPEGTTTNNRYILPFATGAFVAGVPVQPVVLEYSRGRVSPCWDGIEGSLHIYYMLTEPFFSVTAYILPVYEPSADEAKDPHLYANNVRAYMLKYSKLHLQPTSATFKHKIRFYELEGMHRTLASKPKQQPEQPVVHAKAE